MSTIIQTVRLQNQHAGEVLELCRGSLPPHREGPSLHLHHLEDEEGVASALE